MKRVILAVTTVLAILAVIGVCKYGAYQEQQAEIARQAEIDSKTVVAYQVADDGAMQITFANGEGYYFENMSEVLDHMDKIYNYNFITELKDCYEGNSALTKLNLLDLSIKMQRVEMFGVAELQ